MIEVFNEVSKRIIQGIMFHEEMADYFDFLNLHGLKRWHETRYIEESCSLRGLHRYVVNHCNRLIDDGEVKANRYISSSWYNTNRLRVDTSARRQAVRDTFDTWYKWECETKEFYEKMFKTLTENSKIAEANKINELIKATDHELKIVARKMLEYKAVDYDMQYIMFQQEEMHAHYEEKLKNGFNIRMC